MEGMKKKVNSSEFLFRNNFRLKGKLKTKLHKEFKNIIEDDFKITFLQTHQNEDSKFSQANDQRPNQSLTLSEQKQDGYNSMKHYLQDENVNYTQISDKFLRSSITHEKSSSLEKNFYSLLDRSITRPQRVSTENDKTSIAPQSAHKRHQFLLLKD